MISQAQDRVRPIRHLRPSDHGINMPLQVSGEGHSSRRTAYSTRSAPKSEIKGPVAQLNSNPKLGFIQPI
jgi:hypothetical protein